MRRRSAIRSFFGLGLLPGLLLWACGGGSSPTGPSSSGGGNSDSAAHWVASDPHPSHEDCPELNSVGVLQPGERRTSGNLVTTRSCGFHDHDNPGTRALQGTVTIQ